MALVTENWTVDILLLAATLLYVLYWFYSSSVNHFKNRGIPYLKPIPIVGHLGVFTKHQLKLAQDLYNSFPGQKFFGYFEIRVPTLLVKDLDLVQRIMVKDFVHFQDRGFKAIEGDMLSKNLFFMRGQTWRSLRNRLTPTFTSGKLKLMFNQFNETGEHLLENLEQSSVSGEAVDAKVVSVNFATEVIASCAFGLDFSKDNPQTVEFVSRISNIFITGFRASILAIVFVLAPKVVSLLRLSFFAPGVQQYFTNLVKASKEYRRQNNIKRNDYFQLLLSLQEAEESGKNIISPASDNNEDDAVINQMEHAPQSSHPKTETRLLTDEGVTAQVVVFLMGGADSVSSTLSLALYHIAKDLDIQARLVEELNSTLIKHGGWTYQAIRELTYLDQVLQETLRLYPILPITMRECTIPYHIPDSDVVLEKGAIVAIPVGGLHRDPKYYPDPEVFNPDRFTDNNHKPNPTYMPFGDGPRICIAMRFAVVEMKVCLAKILSQYSLEVNKKTQEPLIFDRSSFTPKTKGGIWIDFKKVQHNPS